MAVLKTTEKIINSPKWSLVGEDIKRISKDTLIFASPILVIILTELQAGKGMEEIKPLVATAALQLALNLLRKLTTDKTYVVDKEVK